jgi:hypothetical protein
MASEEINRALEEREENTESDVSRATRSIPRKLQAPVLCLSSRPSRLCGYHHLRPDGMQRRKSCQENEISGYICEKPDRTAGNPALRITSEEPASGSM